MRPPIEIVYNPFCKQNIVKVTEVNFYSLNFIGINWCKVMKRIISKIIACTKKWDLSACEVFFQPTQRDGI